MSAAMKKRLRAWRCSWKPWRADLRQPSLLRWVERLEVGLGLGAQGGDVELEDQLVFDGLAEGDAVDAPDLAVGEGHPVGALVGGVVYGLFDELVLELEADGLDLEEEGQGSVEADGQVAVGAADRVLGGDSEYLS
jgi:hypothetical protein